MNTHATLKGFEREACFDDQQFRQTKKAQGNVRDTRLSKSIAESITETIDQNIVETVPKMSESDEEELNIKC